MQETYTEMAIKNIDMYLSLKGIAISKMEREVGLSQGYFSRLKGGKLHGVAFETIVKMAKFLNVSLNSLIEDNSLYEELEILKYEIEKLENLYQSSEKQVLDNGNVKFSLNKKDMEMIIESKKKRLEEVQKLMGGD